ncbi:Anthranilate phosphoribosyltransferase [Anatilimnocola aggregata]|uniref:Anthranilate phosphoribosyltransferase n=1 Tax=Anatilimnocola aggregata TaxID=2528021 RepID=A0A517YBT8_9BACT|nr:anthranilate phosphoribosyltransferase [Anatilimnocola aggregata]QDU27639.1 Anthranilate phosphoribosyltransferase [Anatilimnocola aggregata]
MSLPSSDLRDWTHRLQIGEPLSRAEIRTVFDRIMQGAETEDDLAGFLVALHDKGETAEEIAGAAEAMRSHMTRLPTERGVVVDTCGTGGTGSDIFNVSTAAAIVTAAAGVAVAKHGNRSVTSKSGSSDVLAALGINLQAPVAVMARTLDELGICFCFAPQFHPAMKHVAAARKRLGTQTIFNLLGPLCNPAGAKYQVMGVGRSELRSRMAGALQQLQTERAVIVGSEGCGELSLAGETEVIEIKGNAQRTATWSAADFGLKQADFEAMRIDGPAASAALIRRIYAGEAGPPRDIVVMNAAAAIWIATPGLTVPEAADRAQEAIDRGTAAKLLQRWAAMTQETA